MTNKIIKIPNLTGSVSERKLLWDAMNRLRGISDDGYVSLYWYDAGGNRTVKEHQSGEAVWVNGTAAGANTDSVSYSIYPNPYISISGDRWTKHYYIGAERIASRTGTISGGFTGINDPDNPNVTPAGPGNNQSVNYADMCRAEEDSIGSAYARLGLPYGVQGIRGGDDTSHLVIPITNINERNDGSADSADAGRDRNHPSTLGDGQVYFYLRDHLGSTLSVTDSVGNYAQQVEYTPWGEVFVERRIGSSGHETPFLFNGKELDEETGLYYYGARYYDPKMSVWYSTDPMEEKYPWVTTYGYCLNNPINSIDFEGNKVLFVNGYYNSGALSIYAGSNCCENYWSKSFINAGMSYFGESGGTPFFIDGRGKWNSSGSDRFNEGVLYAKNHYSEIISGLEKDEPINVVSHSMGSAYAEGIISFLISRDIKIGEVVHLSSADPSCFNAHSSNTYQLQYENDPILLYKNFGEKNIISGVNRFGIIKYDGPHDYSHGKTKFDPETWNALKDLKSIKLNFIKNEELYYYGQMSFSIRQGVYNSGKSSSTQFKSLFINGSSYSYKNNNTYYGRPE